MIKVTKGNILKADAEAIVNTVNCVGVMGKGIALQFKMAHPQNFLAYKKVCDSGNLYPGKMHIFETMNLVNPKYIINFPTKRHWKGNSDLKIIAAGLKSLKNELMRLNIRSIAIPPLGCGNGGLEWAEVRSLIKDTFANLADISVLLYAPLGAPDAETMPIAQVKPIMTRARALIVELIERYSIPGYQLTLLEIQKLAYFLQFAGENLQLKYTKSSYGPYASNLNHLLQKMNGHFIQGYGDRTRISKIYNIMGAKESAAKSLRANTESLKRLDRVQKLIEGFENPYGMELLATVHWVINENKPIILTEKETVNHVFDWNERKRKIFDETHILIARNRILEHNWIHN